MWGIVEVRLPASPTMIPKPQSAELPFWVILLSPEIVLAVPVRGGTGVIRWSVQLFHCSRLIGRMGVKQRRVGCSR
jgi:hypothetical protein